MLRLLRRLREDLSGATAIEYSLIAALIAIVIITGVSAIGNNLKTRFTNVAGNISAAK